MFVSFAWIFFRSPDFETAALVLQRFTVFAPVVLVDWLKASTLLAVLFAVHVVFYRIELERITAKVKPVVFAFAYGASVALTLPFVNLNVRPFIYFQF